ncbi:MAG: hypothetical protein A3E80_05980 [Chlamydiae bacterium RIFCSPHIGHO2_12_FULL_49_9]|nr:MAG: hypothetical protein A3E80_05980 [Chlamydiae bacterium RIFCSPHIGHO2_12_FULL_49_9]
MYKFVIFAFLLHSAFFSKLTAYDQTFIIERIQNGFDKEDPEEIFQWLDIWGEICPERKNDSNIVKSYD